jgi:hypothetical protein
MMRIVSILLVLMSFSLVSAQEGGTTNPPEQQKPRTLPEERLALIRAETERLKKEQENAPTTLAEAHARLEQTLSPETLAKIDAMPSEDGMIQYHFSLGLNIRNGWGLWARGPLAEHMKERGFIHPDDMSGVILDTFWCKRHGKDFRLEERAAEYKKYWDGVKEKKNRVQEAQQAMRNKMIELRFEKRDVPTVTLPIASGMNVRFMCPFRGGVLLIGYCQGSISSSFYCTTEGYDVDPVDGELRLKPEYDDGVARGFCTDPADRKFRKMKPGEDFYTQGWYFDSADDKIHWIRLPELNEIYATVVVGRRAWFAGESDGKAILVGIGDEDRITVPLPEAGEIPDLGFDGQSLLAVYSKKIYRLADRTWMLAHSGDLLLPRSGLPPQRHGNRVFLRDEGSGESRKRLWWLTMGEPLHLSVINRDVDKAGFDGSAWHESYSYCVTSSGDLWACGGGSNLLRRAQDGSYSFAIIDESIRLAGDPPRSEEANQGLRVSGVTALLDDTLLLVGETGLYRLKGSELTQELAFAPQDRDGKAVGRYNWTPNNVVALDDGSYVISTASWRGVHLLRKGDDGQWSAQSPDRGDPIVW